jgi:hypothetical protein
VITPAVTSSSWPDVSGDVTGAVAALSQEGRQSSIEEQMMNLALWIVAGVLAAVLLVASISKLFMSKEKLATFPGSGWVEDFSPGAGRLRGVGPLRPRAFPRLTTQVVGQRLRQLPSGRRAR